MYALWNFKTVVVDPVAVVSYEPTGKKVEIDCDFILKLAGYSRNRDSWEELARQSYKSIHTQRRGWVESSLSS
jgi:hypothetical protein